MVNSDEYTTHRIGTGWRVVIATAAVLCAGVLSIVLLIGFNFFSMRKFQEHGRAQNVDAVEKVFLENKSEYDATAAYVAQVAESEPEALRVSWTHARFCVANSDLKKTCREPTEAERELRSPAGVVVWNAKDDGRVFFSFNQEEPPLNYLMFDPQERDPQQFAREHGFTWERDLGDGWSIPGSILDDGDFDDMWDLTQ
jgi:hypothetical protein